MPGEEEQGAAGVPGGPPPPPPEEELTYKPVQLGGAAAYLPPYLADFDTPISFHISQVGAGCWRWS